VLDFKGQSEHPESGNFKVVLFRKRQKRWRKDL